MGWSGGSSLLAEIWSVVRRYIPEDKLYSVFCDLAESFSDRDCDTIYEVVCDEWPETKQWYKESGGEEVDSV